MRGLRRFSLIAPAGVLRGPSPHPPAAASTLLVALGSLQSPPDALRLMLGVVAPGLLGEGARRMRLLKAPFSLSPARMRIKASP